MNEFVKANKAAQFYNVSPRTLRKWAQDNKIQHKVTPNGRYLYIILKETTETTINNEQTEKQFLSDHIIYGRVSSAKQKNDLTRQIKFLQQKFPTYTTITDIGSGINFERKGFKTILEQLFQGNLKKVVVTYQDRWSRFGFSFFQWLFQKFGAEFQIQHTSTDNVEQDLANDLMEIITVFSARYHGRRKYQNSNEEN